MVDSELLKPNKIVHQISMNNKDKILSPKLKRNLKIVFQNTNFTKYFPSMSKVRS